MEKVMFVGKQDKDGAYNSYWKNHWDNIPLQKEYQKNAERTKGGIPIDETVWNKTLNYIFELMSISNTDTVMELCCGNGALTIPMSSRVQKVIGMDISRSLIDCMRNELNLKGIQNINLICADLLDERISWSNNVDKFYCYSSLQYFSIEATMDILIKVYGLMKKGGLFLIGDIPNINKLWDFACTEEFERQFFENMKLRTPAIGTWFEPVFLAKMARHIGYSNVEIIEQPEWQFFSHYRFDLLLTK